MSQLKGNKMPKSTAKPTVRKEGRSSVTGKFVKKGYVNTNKRTTQLDTVKNRTKKSK
jgi:hypothetical protein